MKVLRVLFLILGLAIVATAQKSILTGSVYDAYGALIIGAKITAINEKGEKFEALTNNDGIYILNLPYNPYRPEIVDFKIAKYEIIVEKELLEKTTIKNFKFAPSYKGKVNLDFAMDVFVDINTIPIQIEKDEKEKPKLKSELHDTQTAVLTGTVKLDKKLLEGAVVKIRDENYNEYFAKTDKKGNYRVILPFGKYFIYSTVNDKCWMCAEFYKRDFLINKEGEINLDIELQFMGEG